MAQAYGAMWRRLGRIEKAFLVTSALFVLLYFSGLAAPLQVLVALAAFALGLVTLFRLAQRGMKRAIWRLRNRLIAAYLFIAVVPIVLILTLVRLASIAVMGQMAVYLVNTELQHRINGLVNPAEMLARGPGGDPELMLERLVHARFPSFEVLVSGASELHYPKQSHLEAPPSAWRRANGLVLKDGNLYAWAHALSGDRESTLVAPITHEFLVNLVPGLGDVSVAPLTGHARENYLPAKTNMVDFQVDGIYPLEVPAWDGPQNRRSAYLVVNSRLSAVLGMVFGQEVKIQEGMLGLFAVITAAFLVVELVSLVAGLQLSRSITGAVHELYEGTQRIKEADFSYRIPVKGNDQLAELSASFNTMTEHLGRLIVVAKEKERLESELAIAREVQDQLFPKDVPYTKTLELKGVCHPARMVSGDYYDFLSLSDTSIAFAIGDVAGKGISAALLMAAIQSTMRTQLGAWDSSRAPLSAAALVSTLNRQLYANTSPEKYATFYFALYNEPTNQLSYTNAGHLAPILLSGTTVHTLDSTGTVVGAFPTARYEEKTVRLGQGDILVAYTDGIVEPENAYGEMFGEERLKELIVRHAQAESGEIIERVMEAVLQWTGSSELQDDMTLVVARRI